MNEEYFEDALRRQARMAALSFDFAGFLMRLAIRAA
jgi:hypothetical protein